MAMSPTLCCLKFENKHMIAIAPDTQLLPNSPIATPQSAQPADYVLNAIENFKKSVEFAIQAGRDFQNALSSVTKKKHFGILLEEYGVARPFANKLMKIASSGNEFNMEVASMLGTDILAQLAQPKYADIRDDLAEYPPETQLEARDRIKEWKESQPKKEKSTPIEPLQGGVNWRQTGEGGARALDVNVTIHNEDGVEIVNAIDKTGLSPQTTLTEGCRLLNAVIGGKIDEIRANVERAIGLVPRKIDEIPNSSQIEEIAQAISVPVERCPLTEINLSEAIPSGESAAQLSVARALLPDEQSLAQAEFEQYLGKLAHEQLMRSQVKNQIDSSYCPEGKQSKWYEEIFTDGDGEWSRYQCYGCEARCGKSKDCADILFKQNDTTIQELTPDEQSLAQSELEQYLTEQVEAVESDENLAGVVSAAVNLVNNSTPVQNNTVLTVGATVAHSDPYDVKHGYHGIVEEIRENEFLVCWKEREGRPGSPRDWYEAGQLKLIEMNSVHDEDKLQALITEIQNHLTEKWQYTQTIYTLVGRKKWEYVELAAALEKMESEGLIESEGSGGTKRWRSRV